ncbi:hypothetical protein [Salipiger bermudensis]|uniref:Metallophosphoesterase n=1 Tax=Salipiger bermudensis (strain DSM 26914 / JCM 13377 / KCTC 12554 / HTCC2601) TaxID=314265 RepID=Q0FIX4_SALBH|nr:hypothetical protein [Salipiger bermudensis]EAU44149.1 hypothetical protein R2601_11734 [Salipiger bermudensis HTCC2601]
MAHWYTADLHFGHEAIIRFCKRPFRSASHMDGALLENLWSKVGPEDDLWIVGDFAWGKRSDDEAWLHGIFQQLPGARRHLVIGNHDGAATRALPWDSIGHLAQVEDAPKEPPLTLCHYPMITWEHARRGALQLFGHVHENWTGTRNSVNVGADVWDYCPVQFKAISRRARNLPVNSHWKDAEPRSAGA